MLKRIRAQGPFRAGAWTRDGHGLGGLDNDRWLVHLIGLLRLHICRPPSLVILLSPVPIPVDREELA